MTFHKYDADTLEEIASVNVGTSFNYTFGFSEDGKTAYILSYNNSKVVVVDISSGNSMTQKNTISLSGQPYIAGGFMPTSYVWKNIIEKNKPMHSHTWEYAAEGNTVKAYCTNAEGADGNCTYQGTENAATLTLTANDTEYSNNAYTGASVTADGISSVTGATVGDITYYLSDGSTQTNADNSGAEGTGKAPKYAGNYVAKVTVTDSEDVSKTATASDTFEIKKGTYSGTKTVSGNILARCASSDVEVTLPAIPEHMVCGVPSYSAPITSATVENGKVKYSADNTAEASKDYTITVPVTEKTGETANYSDYNITITLTGIECSHSSTTPVAAVEATCMTDGMKAYDLCSVCGSKLVNGAIQTDEELKIPKTGHTLTYTANGATLSVTCSKDSNHKAALTLTAASPTYSGDGVTTGWNEGEKVAFTLAGEEDWKAVLGADSIPAIQYYLENGSVTTSENSGAAGEGQAPVKVGKYVAKIAGSDVTASKAFEIKASNTQGGGGNSTPSIPSGGDNKPSTPAEDYTIPVKSENTVEVKAEIKEGTADVSEITAETINKVTDAKGESKVDTIKIDLSGAKQEVTGVTISKKSVETLAKATKDNTNGIDTVTIELSKATVVLDTKTLETLAEDAKGTNIRLVVDDKEHKELNTSQQTAVKDYHVATSFEAYFESDGARIHDFKGGKATVSIAFTPEEGKSIEHYHMVYLPDEGGMTRFKTKYENGQLIFTTTHFSDYAVIYDENEKNETGNEEEKPVEQKPAETQVAANTIAINKRLKVSQTGSKINVSWGKVSDADGYLVYAAYCGTDFGKAVKTIKDPSGAFTTITKINGKKLDLKKNFKVYVKAYKLVDGKKIAFGKSIVAHITGTKNTKNTNVKELKLTSKSKLVLAVGKTSKIKAKVVLVEAAKKQLSDAHAVQFRYASSDKKIATVDKNGRITAKAKGTCYIYVYARNGYAKKVTVTVK